MPATATASIGQKAVATKRSSPPSGNSVAIVAPPAATGTASTAVRPSSGRPLATARAAAASARKAPATGLASTQASARTAASTRHARPACSAHSQAPTASAMPSVNGIRPITTLLRTAAANSHVAPAAAPGVGAAARASGAKRAVAATAPSAPTHAGPGHAASGANSIE